MNYKFKVGYWRKRANRAANDRREDSQTWCGHSCRKLPSDCFAMQTLLHRCRPQVLVELGSQAGGSALFFSSFASAAGIESIISVDIENQPKPKIPIATFITGDSGSQAVFDQVAALVGGRTCSVIVDSNHHAEHVDKELALYAPLVSPGQALIMEDTLVDVLNFKKFRAGGGPLRSIQNYMPQHPELRLAEGIEPYITTNYFGYWVKKK